MEALDELERMALNARTDDQPDTEPTQAEIARWQRLFNYTRPDAITQLKAHNSNLARPSVSNEHWAVVRARYEALGYDRQAYEHSLEHGRRGTAAPSTTETKPTCDNDATYIFKLDGPLCDATTIRHAASLSAQPDVVKGTGDAGEALFCRVDAPAKRSIEAWLSRTQAGYHPTFVRLTRARKLLSPHSIYPTLGLDSTMPQHRLPRADAQPLPAQDQVPVWYFFYGTLADPLVLAGVLGLSGVDGVVLRPARVWGGRVGSWGGKYRALVDGPADAWVDGSTYLVTSAEQEDALRFYETDRYEVVRCRIFVDGAGEGVGGCTFRFIGTLS